MLKNITEWREVVCCPLCLEKLLISDSQNSFICRGCKEKFRYNNNIPTMLSYEYRATGVKESTELTAQIKEHAGKYIDAGTNDKVKKRVAEVLAKHKIITNSQSSILEIGSGPFESLHDVKGGLKIGIDPLASEYLANLPFVRSQSNIAEALAEVLPFKNNYFDVVVSRNSFDHLNDPEIALLEFHRVLKKNGLCVIECYVDSTPFVTHEPFVLTEKFIDNYITNYFEILHRKRLQKPANFCFDWIEIVLTPKVITLNHRPYNPTIYRDVAESYLELFARGCKMIDANKFDSAIEYMKQSMFKKENHFWNVVYLIYVYLKMGYDMKAHQLIETVKKNIRENIYIYVDDPEKALNEIINS